MILIAGVCAIFITITIICIVSLFGPGGSLRKNRKISTRIYEGSNDSAQSEDFGELLKRRNYSDIESLDKLLKQYKPARKISDQLEKAGYGFSVSVFYIFTIFIMLFLFYVTYNRAESFSFSFITSCLGGYMPFLFLKFKEAAYQDKFAELLPNALSIISNSIKVGQSLETGFEAVANADLKSVSTEFMKMRSKIQLGQSLHHALHDLYTKVPISEVKIFATGVSIHEELGGNLSETLGILEHTLRERFALKREVKALSAQGVMSSWVLLCIPFAISGVWYMGDPAMVTDWLATTGGKIGVAYCIIVFAVAFGMVRKIVKIDY